MNGATEDTLAVLGELLRWQKAVAIPQVRLTIDRALGSEPQRRAYDAADGTQTLRELAKVAGVSTAAAGNWSKRWRQLGIASLNREGRLLHLGNLESFGLAVTGSESDTDG